MFEEMFKALPRKSCDVRAIVDDDVKSVRRYRLCNFIQDILVLLLTLEYMDSPARIVD